MAVVPGGAMLFATGEDSDAMYIVLSGCLGVFAEPDRKQTSGPRARGRYRGRDGADLGAGPLGYGGRACATASWRACPAPHSIGSSGDIPRRCCESRNSRSSGSNTRRSRGRARSRGARTFTIVPQSLDLDAAGFASEFVRALARFGRAELVWSVRGATHTSHWFHRIESANDFVVYVSDPNATPWSSLCVRQADALMLLARAEGEVGAWGALSSLRDGSTATQRAELVLLHDETITQGAASRWLTAQPGIPHHHVTGRDDIARVARLLTGHGNGIVFSGGGARGFAHIGIVKALREAGISIDLVGGTSLGGIIGAAVAANWNIEEMRERFHRTFVAVNPLGDYTFPVVSLTSGRRVSKLLHGEFGELAIEDLPLPFFCVSSNLTTGHSEVHRRGLLWRWLRASVAIPGVLPPVMNHGEVLVDGGTMNNLPVDVMRELARGPVIGCDVGADRAFTSDGDDEMDMPTLWQLMAWLRRKKQRRPNIFRILWRAGMVNSAATTMAHREKTDMLLQPPLAEVDMLNWKAFDRAIELGYEYTVQAARRTAKGFTIVERHGAGDAHERGRAHLARQISRSAEPARRGRGEGQQSSRMCCAC